MNNFEAMVTKKIGKIYPGNVKLEHHPTSWLLHAYELKRAEELIYMDILADWDKMSIERSTKQYKPHPVTPDKLHYFIIGLALENILKCLFLNKHPEIIQSGKIEDKLFKTHNLLQIATEKLEIKLNEDEKFLLDLTTRSIKWYGRYPIPLKEKDTILGVETNRTIMHTTFHILFDKFSSLAKIKMPHH